MTKQLTRQEVEAVVEKIADKEECRDIDGNECMPILKPTTIGNVLLWMQNSSCEHMDNDTFGIYCKKLCLLWEPLIFTRSLQEIIDGSGWKTMILDEYQPCEKHIDILQSPEANALFSFLQEIL